VRDEAVAATRRATTVGRPARPRRGEDASRVDPEVAAEVAGVVGDQRGQRLVERLAAASAALDRERYDEARRLVTPLVRELPAVAAVHEVAGLVNYRQGRWRQAAASLETARSLHSSVELLPVLADTYRALRRWNDVDEVYDAIKRASPPHEVMAEGRIVVAGAMADRGDLASAIQFLTTSAKPPKKVRTHHLRQWYVIGDLHDRAGDTVAARRWFRLVADHDPTFVDVDERLRALGR
jgi:predicted Zn-dependent protease